MIEREIVHRMRVRFDVVILQRDDATQHRAVVHRVRCATHPRDAQGVGRRDRDADELVGQRGDGLSEAAFQRDVQVARAAAQPFVFLPPPGTRSH